MEVNFELEGEYIPLDGLLKRCSLASSGAEAHLLVDDGKVKPNGKNRVAGGLKSTRAIPSRHVVIPFIFRPAIATVLMK